MARESKSEQRYRHLVLKHTADLIDAGELALHEGAAGTEYFHRPGEVLLSPVARDALADQLDSLGAQDMDDEDGPVIGVVRMRLPDGIDVHDTIQQLRKAGGVGPDEVGPHHVLFSAPRYHGCPGRPPSVAEPTTALQGDPEEGAGVLVAILDTGQAQVSLSTAWATAHVRPGAELDVLDTDNDQVLDLVAGHGTFVAGIVRQVAPGADVLVLAPLSPSGVTDDLAVARAVLKARAEGADVLNLSFGGYAEGDTPPMALSRVLGKDAQQAEPAVVVAAAGNDASERPFYPAALPGVVAVAALNSVGRRAAFSNFGPWVDACADGDRLLSDFVTGEVMTDSDGDGKRDVFEQEWAYWSGTSFAAPQVAAAIAVQMSRHGETAQQAVASLLSGLLAVRRPGVGARVTTGVRSHPRTPGRP